jgi:hypothetical protein
MRVRRIRGTASRSHSLAAYGREYNTVFSTRGTLQVGKTAPDFMGSENTREIQSDPKTDVTTASYSEG